MPSANPCCEHAAHSSDEDTYCGFCGQPRGLLEIHVAGVVRFVLGRERNPVDIPLVNSGVGPVIIEGVTIDPAHNRDHAVSIVSCPKRVPVTNPSAGGGASDPDSASVLRLNINGKNFTGEGREIALRILNCGQARTPVPRRVGDNAYWWPPPVATSVPVRLEPAKVALLLDEAQLYYVDRTPRELHQLQLRAQGVQPETVRLEVEAAAPWLKLKNATDKEIELQPGSSWRAVPLELDLTELPAADVVQRLEGRVKIHLQDTGTELAQFVVRCMVRPEWEAFARTVVAIDFGTRQSKVAVLRAGSLQAQPVRFPDETSPWAIPTALFRPREGGWLIGAEAERFGAGQPEGLVIGHGSGGDGSRSLKTLLMQNVQTVEVRGEQVPLAQAIGDFIGALFQQAMTLQNLSGLKPEQVDLILTHPVFDKAKNQAAYDAYVLALREAARWAGFDLNQVETVEESVAAAHYYARNESMRLGSLIVVDSGAGTTDTAILVVSIERDDILGVLRRKYELVPGGAVGARFGGRNVDLALLGMFDETYGLMSQAYQTLENPEWTQPDIAAEVTRVGLPECEKFKQDPALPTDVGLTGWDTSTTVHFRLDLELHATPFHYAADPVLQEIRRAIESGDFGRYISCCETTRDRCDAREGRRASAQRVFLAGGNSLMSCVASAAIRIFGDVVIKPADMSGVPAVVQQHVLTAIACGAIYCYHPPADKVVQETYGINVGGRFTPLLYAGDTYPVRRPRQYTLAADALTGREIPLYRQPDGGTDLSAATCVARIRPAEDVLQAGAAVTISMEVAAEGQLEVTLKQRSEGAAEEGISLDDDSQLRLAQIVVG